MTNQEIIQKLKENTSAFGLMPKELQDEAKKIGWGKPDNVLWEYYLDDGWLICAGFGRFADSWAYRLRPDYNPEPEYDKFEIEDGGSNGTWSLAFKSGVGIQSAVAFANFSHFEKDDGNKIGIEDIATYIHNGGKVFVVLRKE